MAELRNRATLDTTNFQSGLGKMQGQVQNLSRSLRSIPGLGGALSVTAIVAGAGAMLRAADEIDNLAKQSDLGVEALQALKVQAKEAGVSFDTMRPTINALRRSVASARDGNEAYSKSFETLGISMSELRRMSTEQVLDRVAKAMAENTDNAEMSVATTKVLGAESTRLNKIFQDLGNEGLGVMIERLKEANQIMDKETIQTLDRVEERFTRNFKSLQVTLMSWFADISDNIIAAKAFAGALSAGSSAAEAQAIAIEIVRGGLEKVKTEADDATASLEEMNAEMERQTKAAVELQKLQFNERFGQMPIEDQLADLEKMAERQRDLAAIAFDEGDDVARLEAYKQVLEIEEQIAKLREEQAKMADEDMKEREARLKGIIDSQRDDRQDEQDARRNEERRERLRESIAALGQAEPRLGQAMSSSDLAMLALNQIRGKDSQSETRAEKLQRQTNEALNRQTAILTEISNNSQAVF